MNSWEGTCPRCNTITSYPGSFCDKCRYEDEVRAEQNRLFWEWSDGRTGWTSKHYMSFEEWYAMEYGE